MPVLFYDIETRSAADLKVVGAHRYAADPTTGIWCVGYAVDDGPVEIWVPGQPIPEPFTEAARNPDWLIVAHNDAFERVIEERILHPQFGWPLIPLDRRRCTMAMALAAALPGALGKTIEALGLPYPKDKAGAALMRKMAKPLPGGGRVEDAASLERLHKYLRRDVEGHRALYRALPSLTAEEQAVWQLDAVINARGFHTDGVLLDAAHNVVATAEAALQAEFHELTGLDSTNQTAKLIAWMAERGCIVTDVQKGTLRHALGRKELAAEVRRAIELRLELAHASAAKVEALRAWRGDDGRVRGTLGFHGAATGRWIGRGPQPQNFKRDGENIEGKIAAVMNGGTGLQSPVETVGDIARAMISAAPGHRLLIGDFSGIESRVLAWASRQQSKLDAWATFDRDPSPDNDPYVIIGRALGHPKDTARAYGKICDLAFGYQGGVGAWQNFAPEDDASGEAAIKRYRDAWRRQHPATERFWYALDRAAVRAVAQPATDQRADRFVFRYDRPFLRITLPSGRSLSYPFPRIETGKYGSPLIIFRDNASGKFTDCRFGQGSYGGLWTENVVSAIARDLLATALTRLEAAGYPVVLHVHDEIVCEVPDGFGSIEEFQQLVTTLPSWAEGLPVAVKARNGLRFAKIEEQGVPQVTTPAKNAPAANCEARFVRTEPESTVAPTSEPGTSWDDHVDDLYADAAAQAQPTNETSARAENSSTGLQWSTPGLIEAPPGSTEFEPILAALSEEDRAIVRPTAAAGNGHDQDADQQRGTNEHYRQGQHSQQQEHFGRRHRSDGYPHGERDTGHQIAFFIYRHADGQPYLGVKKTSTKQFPQFHAENGCWVKGSPQGPKIPYRLPELIQAPLNAWIVIAAGEKDAETAAALGFVATTNPEGERKGAWAPELNAWFYGRRVAVMEDNDETGRAHVIEVAEALRGKASDIRVVTFRDLPNNGDLTDWVQVEPSRDYRDLLTKIETTKPYCYKPLPSPIRRWDGEPIPELEYAVPNRFPLENVGLFSGEGGQGKSTLVQQLCVAHTIRRQWLGCTPRQGPAIYVECEDAERVLRWRLVMIAAHYGVTLTAIADAGFQMFPLTDEENTVLATAPDKSGIVRPTPLYDWLYELAGDVKPVMIGIASSANVFAGNENVRTEVQQFIRLLRRIACVAHGTVLLVTQPSLSGIDHKSVSHEGLAGTTQWHNAVRARAVMATVKTEDGIDTGLRQIKFHKNQYGLPNADCFVRYEAGLFLPVEGMSMDAAQRAAKAEEVFVTLLRKFTAQKQMVSPNPSSTYAPARFAEHSEAQGISKKEFARAMQRLLDIKTIEIRTWGKPSKPIRYLAVAGEG
jgi:DNA polymerase